MPISDFYRQIRERVGHSLLLIPAAAAIVRDGSGRVLFQQLHDDSWTLPSGAIEPGETPAEAIVRETYEETGLVITPLRIAAVLGGSSCRVRYENQDEVEYVVTVFECRVEGGALIESNDETKSLAYFPPDSPPPLGFPYPAALFERPDAPPYFTPARRRSGA